MLGLSADALFAIEVATVLCGLAFVILIIKEIAWGWLPGIVQSMLSVALFLEIGLYSEAVLYVAYIGLGVYGWMVWHKRAANGKAFPVTNWDAQQWIRGLVIGTVAALGLAMATHYLPNAQRPFIDAFTTTFALLATVLEARKKLPSFTMWIAINAVSVGLYYDRGLYVYAGLMVVYFALSVVGFVRWRKAYLAQSA